MRRALVCALLGVGAIASCVGDDPGAQPGTTIDGGTDTGVSTTPTDSGANDGAVHLGAMVDGMNANNGTNFVQGDIAEVVVVKDALPVEKRTALETYLKTKHGLL